MCAAAASFNTWLDLSSNAVKKADLLAFMGRSPHKQAILRRHDNVSQANCYPVLTHTSRSRTHCLWGRRIAHDRRILRSRVPGWDVKHEVEVSRTSSQRNPTVVCSISDTQAAIPQCEGVGSQKGKVGRTNCDPIQEARFDAHTTPARDPCIANATFNTRLLSVATP